MFQRNGLSCLMGLRLIELDRWSIHFRETWNSNYLLLSKSSVGNMIFHGENSFSEKQ